MRYIYYLIFGCSLSGCATQIKPIKSVKITLLSIELIPAENNNFLQNAALEPIDLPAYEIQISIDQTLNPNLNWDEPRKLNLRYSQCPPPTENVFADIHYSRDYLPKASSDLFLFKHNSRGQPVYITWSSAAKLRQLAFPNSNKAICAVLYGYDKKQEQKIMFPTHISNEICLGEPRDDITH